VWSWELPAGGIEPGEGPVEAAVREVQEETGWELRQPRLVCSAWRCPERSDHRAYVVEGWAGHRVGPHDPDEVSALAWFGRRETYDMLRTTAVSDLVNMERPRVVDLAPGRRAVTEGLPMIGNIPIRDLLSARRTRLGMAMAIGALVLALVGMFTWRWAVLGAVIVLIALVGFAWPEHDCGVTGCTIRNNPWHSHAQRVTNQSMPSRAVLLDHDTNDLSPSPTPDNRTHGYTTRRDAIPATANWVRGRLRTRGGGPRKPGRLRSGRPAWPRTRMRFRRRRRASGRLDSNGHSRPRPRRGCGT
jgi:ADP-ribose pyrophosphatase YjhB (NUDIX family)